MGVEVMVRLALRPWHDARCRQPHDNRDRPVRIQADYLREFRQATTSARIVYAGWRAGRFSRSRFGIARHHKRNGSPIQLWAEIC